jgi:hypothetical protein
MVDRYWLGGGHRGHVHGCRVVERSVRRGGNLEDSHNPRTPADDVRILSRRIAIDPAVIDCWVPRTTPAANTLIERCGGPVGLLVTSGLGDILEIRRLWLPDPDRKSVV